MNRDNATQNQNKQAHLLYKALEQCGNRPTTASEIIKLVNRLEQGLPFEDHFMALITWLGQCEIVHKLEQNQYPQESINTIRVPDLIAVFHHNARRYAVAIEVKSTRSKKLEWKPEYYHSLKEYGKVIGIPVLIACYWKEIKLWTLNDLSCFKIAKVNWHLDWVTACKENLLGVLAGDFHFRLKPGVGIHFKIAKLQCEKNDVEQGLEQWLGRLTEIYYTTPEGDKLDTSECNMFPVLLQYPLEEQITNYSENIIISYMVSGENTSMMAQQAVPIYTRDGKLRWNDVLNKKIFRLGQNVLLKGVEAGFDNGMTNYLLHMVPNHLPDWIKKDN